MNQILALDLSTSRLTREWVAQQRASGIEVIYQCGWTGGYKVNDQIRAVCQSNLRAIREGGCIPGLYSNANPWYGAAISYMETKANAGPEYANVPLIMIDIEIAEEGNPIRPEQVKAMIGYFQSDSKRIVTYSADWYVGWWKLQLGDANAVYIGEPYVHARYDGDSNILIRPPVHPIGPLAGKQYRGSHDRSGVTVDADALDASLIAQLGGDDMALLEELLPDAASREAFKRFFREEQFAAFDRLTNNIVPVKDAQGNRLDNGIPWFGRKSHRSDATAVSACYADSVHTASLFAALGIDSGRPLRDIVSLLELLENANTSLDKLADPTLEDYTSEQLLSEVMRRLAA